MKLTTKPWVKGNELGLVYGNVVTSKFFVRDFIAGIKKLLGKELTEYTDMMDKARQIATKRMVEDAEKKGATAIVNIRYTTSMITYQAAEVMAYGTAIKE